MQSAVSDIIGFSWLGPAGKTSLAKSV